MSASTQVKLAILLGMSCVHVLMGGEEARFHRHRHPLGIPQSAPFTLAEAVELPEWGQIRRVTELIKTDRGALELLRELPRVEARYADESYFLDLVKTWRDRVPTLSEGPESTAGSDSSWSMVDNGQSRTVAVTFRDEAPENSLTIMRVTWTDGEVTNVSFNGGFENVLPLRHPYRRGDSFSRARARGEWEAGASMGRGDWPGNTGSRTGLAGPLCAAVPPTPATCGVSGDPDAPCFRRSPR